ncbi:serine/threonine protein kinase [bacterium]|nr:serine/threonine protein kinase [bacterium]
MKFLNNIFGKDRVEKIDLDDRFIRHGRVGQGSMSKVWKAQDKRNQKFVALKVLDRAKMIRYEARFPPEYKKPAEGDIALTLKHPYIVETMEWGVTKDDEHFLVMDFVEGIGLALLTEMQNEQMRRYRLRYMIQIGHGLDYFHKKNWIHRDLCPRNIMVSEKENNIQLIDFGLVVPNTSDFRKPGNRTGTANYMAPELIKRQPTDQRIDLFSYAVTCYEMYAKRLPWDAALTLDAVVQHINKPPVQLKELVPSIDDQIAETIMKGLAIDPNDRWQSAAQMTKAFKEAEKRMVMARRKKAGGNRTASVKKADPATARRAAKKSADDEIDDLAALAAEEMAETKVKRKSRTKTPATDASAPPAADATKSKKSAGKKVRKRPAAPGKTKKKKKPSSD